MGAAAMVLASWNFLGFNRIFSAFINKNVGLSSDDRHPVLPAHARRAGVPAPRCRLSDPGADARRGVCPGAQVCAARAAEAVKRKTAD
jgi:hypothetical protein